MAQKIDFQPNPINLKTKRNVINVTVPAKDYFDLGRMQEIQKEVLLELGCKACHSGWDIRFDMHKHFSFSG